MVNFSYLSSGTLRGFAGGRVSAALAIGAMAKPHRSAAAATPLVRNRGAFIFSPGKLGEGLEECLRTRIGSGCEDDTNWMQVLAADLYTPSMRMLRFSFVLAVVAGVSLAMNAKTGSAQSGVQTVFGFVSCCAVGEGAGWAVVTAVVERSDGGAADADRRYAEEPDGCLA